MVSSFVGNPVCSVLNVGLPLYYGAVPPSPP